MTLHRLILATAGAVALGAAGASADCREELAQLTGGVAKDASMAPLEGATGETPQTGGDSTPAAKPPAAGIAKDASTAPLGTDPSLATSGQDVAAQQEGGATAAEQAEGEAPAGGGGSEREEAIKRAEAALASGDEAGCMAAVEEAKGL